MIADGDIQLAIGSEPQRAAVVLCGVVQTGNNKDLTWFNADACRVAVPFDDAETVHCTNIEDEHEW